MTYAANEQYSATTPTTNKRFRAGSIRPKTFGAGSGTLAKLTPVTFYTALGTWGIWQGPSKSNAIETISSTGTISGGNWTITINGETTANIAHNANTATIQAAIDALGNVDSGDVVVTGGPLSTNTSVVLTFGGQFAKESVTVTASLGSLTGGGSASLAHTQAGVAIEGFKGFVYEDVALAAANEVLGNVILSGEIHIDDIPVVTASYSLAELKAELRTAARPLNFTVHGLENVR